LQRACNFILKDFLPPYILYRLDYGVSK